MQSFPTHTALRGIAAMLVVYGHYTYVFLRDIAGTDFFVPHTHLGVDFFFLLSGFILTQVYAHSFQPGVTGPAYRQFLLRRLARIYPLHLATLLVVIALMRFHIPADGQISLVRNLTLTHAWGISEGFEYNSPSWSISCEFAAYLAFPLLMPALRSTLGRAARLALGLAAYAVLWRAGQGSLDLDAIGRGNELWRAVAAFPLGMLIAHVQRNHTFPATALQIGGLLGLVAGLALALPEILLILPLAALLLGTAAPSGPLVRALSPRPLWLIGEISYGIYLIQWPVMLFLFNLRPKLAPHLSALGLEAAALVIFLILLFALSLASHRWFERPFIRAARSHSKTL